MQLPLLVFEEYVDKFQQKVASLKKQPASPKRRRPSRPSSEDDEFELLEDSEEDGIESMGISSFLRKFKEVLPANDLEKFEFLLEAHYRNVVQFQAPEGRFSSSSMKVKIQGVPQSSESMPFIEFLEIFFAFSKLSKEIGIAARTFPGLMINKCQDWYPQEDLVQKFTSLNKEQESFFLLYTLAHYVNAGFAKRIELTVFRTFVSAKDYLIFMHSINQNKQAFLNEGLWKIEKDMWDQELTIVVKEKAIQLILPEFRSDETEEFDRFRVIAPADIPSIDLFFEESTQRSLDRLTAILKACPSELWNTRRYGVLLAGESGCGKTEFVMQLCKQLGLMCVSVSSLSSKWIGESEQAIVRILEVEFPRLMKEYNNKVVLYFDEIDQSLGKKVEIETHSSFYTNAVVSQMLKSMDRFKGILIGSANVVDRMESAGLRRFETLISFSLPSRAARKAIWASREGFWQTNEPLLERLAEVELSGSDIHSICSRGFFLQYAGEAFAEESLFELIADQEVLAAKTRYQKSASSTIGFQKIAS
jgi:hypothetical protein